MEHLHVCRNTASKSSSQDPDRYDDEQRRELGWAIIEAEMLRAHVCRRLSDRLDGISVASPCHVSWEAMQALGPGARVRLCGECRMNVYDLSDMTRAAFCTSPSPTIARSGRWSEARSNVYPGAQPSSS